MWAVTPEGRATNVGEVLLNGGKSRLDATTELQSFGADYHRGAVLRRDATQRRCGDGEFRSQRHHRHHRTGGRQVRTAISAGSIRLNVKPSDIKPRELDQGSLELYEARNAVQIARWTGADRYAADTYLKATQGLENAEGYLNGKAGKKPIGTVAREAVQMAEDARIITIKKMDEERLISERQAGADREKRAENGHNAARNETARVTEEAATRKRARRTK